MTRRPHDIIPFASKLMTVKEVADYLKLHPTTIYHMLKRGELPAFRVGSDWRFNIEEIDAWRLGKKA